MSSPQRRRQRTVRGSFSLHRVSVVFAFALIILSLIGGGLPMMSDARAQAGSQATDDPELVDDPPIDDRQRQDVGATEEAQVPDLATEVPELVEDPTVTIEAAPTETELSATNEAEDESTSAPLWASNRLELDVHGCPAGLDAAASSLAQLDAACGDNVGPVSFALDNGSLGDHYLITNGGSPRNHASFSNLDFEDDYAAPNGGEGRPVVLTGSFPAGYASVTVSCAYWNQAAGVTDWGPTIMPLAGDRAIEIAVDAGDTLSCDWFFMPPALQGEDSANVDIPGIAPTPTPNRTTPDPTTPDPNQTIVPIIPIDPINLRPTAPGGFDPIISLRPTEIPAPPSPLPVVTQPGIPLPEPITGTVRVIKYTCPQNAARTEERAQLNSLCTLSARGVEFSVEGNNGYIASATTAHGAPSSVRFTGVPFGKVKISESVTPGFGEPLAFCSDDFVEGGRGSFAPVPVEGGDTITWDVRADTRLPATCIFYNIQDRRDVVRVIKFTCGPDVLPNEEYFRLYDQCHENPGPVEFTVRGTGGYLESGMSDGSIPRDAVFTGVPFGQIEISETIPPGYGEPLAFCSDDPGTLPPVPVDGNTVTWELRPDAAESLECIFFNMPEGGERVDPDAGVVRITKLTCRPGDVSTIFTEMLHRCREYIDPVEFSVTSGSGYRASEFATFAGSPAIQEADFTNVPFGKIEISETVPASHGEPLVWCTDDTLAPDSSRRWTSMTVVGGDTVRWDLQTTSWPVLRCIFFNVEEKADGPREQRGWAQGETQATEVPELVDDSSIDDQQKQDVGATEELQATDVPELAEDSPVEIESVATETEPSETGDSDALEVPGIDPVIEDDPGSSDPTEVSGEDVPGLVPVGPEPIEPETDPTTSRVTVFKLTCPEGVGRSDVVSILFEECGENPGPVEFSVTGEGGYSRSAFTPDSDRQIVAFADVPFGAIAISETVPAGYGVPLAFCSDSSADGFGTFTSVPVDGGGTIALEHRADAESELRCGFVNFPEASEDAEPDTGIVRVSKYTCPASVARSDDDYLLSEQCREDAGPAEFTLHVGGGFFDSAYTSLGVPQETDFTDVPIGVIEIEETVVPPYGEPLAFCSDTPADGTGSYDPVPVADGDTITWILRADAEIPLTCLFFNFVDEGEATGNQLTVTKFDCPEGTSRDGGLPDLGTTCDVLSGVEFTGTFGESSSSKTTDRIGNAEWTDVPAGPWSLQETIPAGYADPKVYCGPMFTTEAPEVAAPGGLFGGEFTGTGEHVACTVFNFLEDGDPDPGTVRVSKYTCPEDVERSEDDYLLSERCRENPGPVEFSVTDNDGYSEAAFTSGDVPGNAEFTGVPFGGISISETIPAGYGEPLAFCSDTPADGAGNYEPVPVEDGNTIAWELRADAEIPLTCLFFNFTDRDRADNVVTIQKWTCAPETVYGRSGDYYYDQCTVAEDEQFPFTLTDASGSHPQKTTGGWATWNDVPAGAIGIQEAIPSAYGEPVVLCFDGTTANFHEAATGYIEHEFTGSGQEFTCDWFNLIGERSSLSVIKHTCPEGYDLYMAGTDPDVDCPELANGVAFTLDLPDGTSMTTATGDAAEGQIQFGGLEPGAYTLTESVPEDTAYAFVLDCYGNRTGSVRPFPLAMGDTLNLEINAGESITCRWYNVPDHDATSLTLVKLTCSTATYISDVDCEVYEDGKTFDLLVWNGSEWEYHSTATTDGQGQIHWPSLTPLDYWLDEQDGDWCHIASDQLSENGDRIYVDEDQETVVTLYNCDGEPGKPGETPTKYPNTGAGPEQGPRQDLPALAPLAGLLALLAADRTRRPVNHSAGEDRASSRLGQAESKPTTISRRRLTVLLTVPLGSTLLVRSGILAQSSEIIEPIDGTPTSLCLPATPEAGDDEAVDTCVRGAVPATLTIEPIAVAAEIEILETVGGVMQAPTGAEAVAWYKETARLGEPGNLVLAGHLNYWGVPEGVFFALGMLRPGDRITVTGDNGETYEYAVAWVRQEDATEPLAEEVLGMTGQESLTLITCGGEWDPSISEYTERTVVRAVRATDAEDGGSST